MNEDSIDRMIQAWKQVLPKLDPSALEVVGRVLVLSQHLQKSVEEALARHELSLGQFDILATLRRQGPNGRMTPTQLMKRVMLSSGGMTNRLDRLEQAGWTRREADPEDRRGVVVALTPKGQKLIDAATVDRFAEAQSSLPPLDSNELQQLTDSLRKWLLYLENGKGQ